MEACQQRFERLKVSGQLKYWWDDLCCHGKPKEKLHEHPVVDIFPSVTRCPYKDGFHAVQLVTGTFNAGTGEVDVHSRDVGSTIRPAYEKDVKKAVDFLVESERLSRPEARREAFKRYRGTGIIRSFGPQPDDLRQRWQGLIDRLRGSRRKRLIFDRTHSAPPAEGHYRADGIDVQLHRQGVLLRSRWRSNQGYVYRL